MDFQLEYERVDDAISAIDEAIGYLKNAGGMDDVIGELTDRMNALKITRETIRREIEAQDAREMEALRREYFAGVL